MESRKFTKPKSHLEILTEFASLPDEAFVAQRTVEALFCCSPATLRRYMARGSIPSGQKLSDRLRRWNVGQLRTAIAQKLEAKQ